MRKVDGDTPALAAVDLGIQPYPETLSLQKRLVEAKRGEVCDDFLLLVQHPDVVTMGTSATERDRRAAARLQKDGFDVVQIRRGGRLTCHTPGQIVGYPIIALQGPERDLHEYIRRVEESIVAALYALEIVATTIKDRTGVWVDDRKVCSIGIAVRWWITYHGFALNVSNDMQVFEHFSPCGMTREDMASLHELGYEVQMADIVQNLAAAFAGIFARQGNFLNQEELSALLENQNI